MCTHLHKAKFCLHDSKFEDFIFNFVFYFLLTLNEFSSTFLRTLWKELEKKKYQMKTKKLLKTVERWKCTKS